jgi:hypothetical protein
MKPHSFVVACLVAASSLCAAQSPGLLPPPPPPVAPDTPVPQPAPQPAAPQAREPGFVRQSPGGLEVREGDAAQSRWQADLERLDADLRLRLLTANEPRIDWLAGEIDAADVESQVRHYAAARTAAPGERLYLASLGVACLQPVRPTLAPCDAVDRLADWARRDADNGIPSVLLAGRARQRGQADTVASYVEQAAARRGSTTTGRSIRSAGGSTCAPSTSVSIRPRGRRRRRTTARCTISHGRSRCAPFAPRGVRGPTGCAPHARASVRR